MLLLAESINLTPSQADSEWKSTPSANIKDVINCQLLIKLSVNTAPSRGELISASFYLVVGSHYLIKLFSISHSSFWRRHDDHARQD